MSETSHAAIDASSSDALPLDSNSMGVVISSPPYCTRIDYAICTWAELSTLGFGLSDFRSLRERLIGTATIAQKVPQPSSHWGTCCLNFLDRVATHPSKASHSYYLKNHVQYFAAIFRSLREIDRTLQPNGRCVLVVQDSYYKDVHNDLPLIFIQMTGAQGWMLTRRDDFPCTRTMARVNGRSSQYRKPCYATETALWFRKLAD
jgi:hypothetical protein